MAVQAMPMVLFVLSMIMMTSCVALVNEEEEVVIETIYQFGDSISDVGNFIREPEPVDVSSVQRVTHLPYGEAYFNQSTGRFSNGLLIVDFLAKALNLPLLDPYLKKDASFTHGVNFAVAGATALDSSFFARKDIRSMTNSSLSVQLDWFKTHLASLCYTTKDCKKKLEKALFLLGEVGGNDYNHLFDQGNTIEEVRTYVPLVVLAIIDAVKKVIDLGATRVVVPGNFPIGCHPMYLTAFGRNTEKYTSQGCLENYNDFAKFHNNHLQHALEKLREQHPDVVIVYADYYYTFLSLLRYPNILGFEQVSLLKACCGVGGDYNFDKKRMCGTKGVSSCVDPDRYVSWDGIHLTQQAYEYIASALVHKLFPKGK